MHRPLPGERPAEVPPRGFPSHICRISSEAVCCFLPGRKDLALRRRGRRGEGIRRVSGRRIEGLTGTQVAANALATMTAAVVASYLGIAGTIIGAAVASAAT